MKHPLISVIMPTLNGASFIVQAIDSLRTQDYAALQIIVVDDGSTDDTMNIVKEVAVQEPRLLVQQGWHGSIAKARNQGLALATGNYVTFLDHDDICPPGKISRQVERLEACPHAAALFGRTLFFASDAEVAALPLPTGGGSLVTMCLSAALFRRDTFNEVGSLDPSFKIADDFDFILRMIEAGLHIEVEEEVATLHRRHPTQVTANADATRREMNLALARSIARRRRAGILAPLSHPLISAVAK